MRGVWRKGSRFGNLKAHEALIHVLNLDRRTIEPETERSAWIGLRKVLVLRQCKGSSSQRENNARNVFFLVGVGGGGCWCGIVLVQRVIVVWYPSIMCLMLVGG